MPRCVFFFLLLLRVAGLYNSWIATGDTEADEKKKSKNYDGNISRVSELRHY